jgi:TonB-dependent receptor
MFLEEEALKNYRHSSALVRSASAIAVAAYFIAGSAAFAQEATADEASAGDEIVVTGVRASLQRAMDIKRQASGVVDAISAEDIGKFPDTNLAESLQRIPGVSIDRVNGEGSTVTARGFTANFNLITLNGRRLPSALVQTVGGDQDSDGAGGTSRSFDFGNIASEGISRLEVYKTGRAAVPSGGIGATINIVTRRPLDSKDSGLVGSIGAKAVYDTSALGKKKITPEVSGLVGWSNQDQTIGFSLYGSYQKRNSSAVSATSNAWNIRTGADFLNPANGFVNAATVITNAPSPTQLVSVPNDSRYHFSESSRERINGQAVLEFKPTDAITITADALYAQNKQQEQRGDQANWFNRPFGQVTFDKNPLLATTVFLQETLNGTKDGGFEQQFRATKSKLQSYGLNAKWDLSDNLKLNLDGHISSANSTPNTKNGTSSTTVSFAAPVIASHSVDFSGDIPVQTIVINDAVRAATVPGGFGTNNNGILDVGDLGSQVARTFTASQKQNIKEVHGDLTWDFGGGSHFDFGGEYIDSKMTSARITTQQTLGDWGVTKPGDIVKYAPGLVEQFCLTCRFDDFNPGSTGSSLIAFRGNAVDLFNILSPQYASQGNANSINGNTLDSVAEKSWAVYGQVTWKGEIGSMPANLVAGVRYEQTRVKSTSLITVPEAIKWVADNDFTIVSSTTVQPITGTGRYNNVLPSMDFSIEPADNLIARVSFGRTIARPEFGDLFSSTGVGQPSRPIAVGGEATGNSGNPNLKPLISDNLDLSLEYYFAKASYVSVGFFDKSVKNFVGSGQVTQPLFGLRDPSSGAPGSRSGTAKTALQGIGADITDVNLFTMTALLQQTGNIATATQQFQANFSNGALNQAFVDATLAAVDITADANDPLFQFAVTQPINNNDAHITGFEIAGQYFLGDTGFGIAGSYTKVHSNRSIDVYAAPSVDQFALLGLADTYNATLIYDNHGVSARLAYTWRDKHLIQTNRGGSSRNPVFIAPFGTLDMNVSYDINDKLALSVEGINLTGSNIRTYGRSESNLFFAQELKPRFLLGARYKF